MKIRLDDILEEALVPQSEIVESVKRETEAAGNEFTGVEPTEGQEETMVPVMRPVEIPIGSSINIRYNPMCQQQTFSFTMMKVIAEDDPNWHPLTSHITLLGDDDVELNDFDPAHFERLELSPNEDAGITYVLMTNDPAPEPVPEPEPPTEEELRAQAIYRIERNIDAAKNAAIQNGVTVETEYGTEHFRLNEKDQILLLGINSMVMAGATAYPYHSLTSDGENNICTIYSDEDIGKIAVVTFAHVTFHESYANMLLQWLHREEDLDVINNQIYYGAVLPQDLIDYLTMILMSSGIDPSMIPTEPPKPEIPEGGVILPEGEFDTGFFVKPDGEYEAEGDGASEPVEDGEA